MVAELKIRFNKWSDKCPSTLNFGRAFWLDISQCWSGRHTINHIHYNQLADAKHDIGQKLDDVRLQPVSGLAVVANNKAVFVLSRDQYRILNNKVAEGMKIEIIKAEIAWYLFSYE